MKMEKIIQESGIDFVKIFEETPLSSRIAWYESFDPNHILGCVITKIENGYKYSEYILPIEMQKDNIIIYINENNISPEYEEILEK